jgi:predicted dehydrogenase
MFDVRCSMFDVRCSAFVLENRNIEPRTLNIERRTSNERARKSQLLCYNSAGFISGRIAQHMAETIRAGIIGAGWPGGQHAIGYKSAGGFKLVAVADLIPERRKKIIDEFGATREYVDAKDLLRDHEIDVVSVCLPNHLHAPITLAALKSGKHVVCEKPPTLTVKEARQIDAAASKAGKIVLYGVQRRFGPHEQAAKQAIAKGYAGDVYHARAAWMRTRGIPIGTGWFTQKALAGGGALIDIGVHMLDIAWYLLGEPRPIGAFGVTHQKFGSLVPPGMAFDVDDAAFALIRFEGGKSLELATSWAINQPPQQQGAMVRVFGDAGGVDVYTPQGATIYRNFDGKGESKATPLKPPRVVHHAALMRHLKECIHGRATPIAGTKQGVQLMQMLEAIYKSSASGRSVEIKA